MQNGEREWIRLREVKRLTGWDWQYVKKLMAAQVLDVRQDLGPRSKRWYRRSQIVEMVK